VVDAACGDDGGTTPPPIDAGPTVTTDHCTFEAVPANAATGTSAAAAPLMAGVGETPLDVPVGTALGGYTARGAFLGMADAIDNREVPLSGGFFPSVGVETRPMAKALALRAGGDTVVWIKVDAIFAYEGFVFDLEERLGAAYAGKVILSTSHSHAAWAQFTAHSPLKVGASERRKIVSDRFLAGAEAAARAAIADLRPARLGVFTDTTFDPSDLITRERRGENDALPGGNRKDDRLHLIRVDTAAGEPMAIVPIFGVHGTLGDDDNPMASTDAPGGVERMLEEQFDRKVLVMHVQSAGADTSPSGHGGVDCDVHPGATSDPCFSWLTEEGHGRAALPELMAAWTAAGTQMQDTLALSMVTRSIELGPYPETFTIRGGALSYRAVRSDPRRRSGARRHRRAGVAHRRVERAGRRGAVRGPVRDVPGRRDAGHRRPAHLRLVRAARHRQRGHRPAAAPRRVGHLRDPPGVPDHAHHDLGAAPRRLPGRDHARRAVGAARRQAARGVAGRQRAHDRRRLQPGPRRLHADPRGLGARRLRAERVVRGPLEAEYIVERAAELMPMAMMPTRMDGAAAGKNRVVPPAVVDDFPIDNPATRRGTVPAAVPEELWMRSGRPATAQPPTQVPRVSGLATFVFYGDDAAVKTPIITIEREVGPAWVTVTRRSGRAVSDADLLLFYAPLPLIRAATPQDHLWAVEWQPVPWTGSGGALDALDHRGALPLGNYRFHVVGDGWTLSSDPFEVTAAPLVVIASVAGPTLTVEVSLHAPAGYRLLDLANPSNRPVRVQNNAVTVVGKDAGGVAIGAPRTGTTSAAGVVTVDFGASAANVVTLEITDSFGNVGSDAL
jgi:hypothetical protein